MTMAQTVAAAAAGSAKGDEDKYDGAALLKDIKLQQSLLNSNPSLRQRFDQAYKEKPESIGPQQFMTQFWENRVHLLRSHAVETSQGVGKYNVLAALKPQYVNGEKKMNLSKEQIHIIFAQHPLVRKAYNENVPRRSEDEFWSQFFGSRLLKKLKGEKINPDTDPIVPFLDKYLDLNVDTDPLQNQGAQELIVPHFLDVEGNEQNHSQRLGNRPDWTMRPNSYDKVPILRTLNRMSEKMMKDVPPADIVDRHAPVGMDEDTYKELQLRDLQRAEADNRVVLKVKDQGRLFAIGQGLHTSSSASTYAKRTPSQVLSTIHKDLNTISPGAALNLESAIGIDEDSSSDEESGSRKKARVGSKSTRTAATSEIVKAIKKRHTYDDDLLSSQDTVSNEQIAKLGVSRSVFDTLSMTHNTTVEFLHYFWAVYYSGDADRANEVARLVETLDKSLDRIKAVETTAELERTAKIDQLRKDNEAFTQRTGRRRKFDPNSMPGGAKAVNDIMTPLTRAIQSAIDQYRKALQEQMSQLPTS
ncbi:hypothetical protein BU24DRAFT_5810 [Aaosphaeria arxii CBS 175.79]|uniref:BSD domain-containing protein n=1 Tax=Aaosphaeria arxii CBS 175.79 TaxID=1450172 RepID=A0A6A5Y629_9PLEO|nr:uncharacterized protein BU24DRAFT_5810 [Aaosphaeria arxii CBS 175.79]KAF2020663.1 hypothetical protein BU24DRAFT_5810 [Aaosphaeria arxii CBS 175.79]